MTVEETKYEEIIRSGEVSSSTLMGRWRIYKSSPERVNIVLDVFSGGTQFPKMDFWINANIDESKVSDQEISDLRSKYADPPSADEMRSLFRGWMSIRDNS